ncbi:MAG TPA: response regulator [Holophagaceae bacterium]|nr:response regulator [Holophagaceae bacterium]
MTPAPPIRPSPAETRVPSPRPHILLVDDEELNREVLRQTLEYAAYDVLVAGDGEEAWSILNDRDTPPIQTILLDRMMPRLDGLGLLARLREDHRLRRIPVILQTGDADPALVAQSIRAGAFYHLTKPFQREVFLSVVEAAFKERLDVEELEQRLDSASRAATLMHAAEFRFQTVSEGRALASLLSQACPEPYDAALGLWELFLNAVEHGNLGLTYEDKGRLLKDRQLDQEIQARLTQAPYRDRWVRVTYQRDSEGHTYTIQDEGAGFDWARYLDLDPDRAFHAHGRGIAMARYLCFAAVSYQGRGNVVVARIKA